MQQMSFDQRFERAFAGGLVDIKFFVRRDDMVTADELRAEALAFQCAIDEDRVTRVEGVD